MDDYAALFTDIRQVCSSFTKYHDLARELSLVRDNFKRDKPRWVREPGWIEIDSLIQETNSFCAAAALVNVFGGSDAWSYAHRLFAAQKHSATRLKDFVQFMNRVLSPTHASYALDVRLLCHMLFDDGHDDAAAALFVCHVPLYILGQTIILQWLAEKPHMRSRLRAAVLAFPFDAENKRRRVALALKGRDLSYEEDIYGVCQFTISYHDLVRQLSSMKQTWLRTDYLPIYGEDLSQTNPIMLNHKAVLEIIFECKSYCVAAALFTIFMVDHYSVESYLTADETVRLYETANATRDHDLAEFTKRVYATPRRAEDPLSWSGQLLYALVKAKYYTAVAHMLVYAIPFVANVYGGRPFTFQWSLTSARNIRHSVWFEVIQLPKSPMRDVVAAELRPGMKSDWFAASARAGEARELGRMYAAQNGAKRGRYDVVDGSLTAFQYARSARQDVVDKTARLLELQRELQTVEQAMERTRIQGLTGKSKSLALAKQLPGLKAAIAAQKEAVEAAEASARRQEAHAAALGHK